MRKSGILCHITSLPSESGKGSLGTHAIRFLDVLQSAGQSVWQILPIHPPDQHNSPYASSSAFAGDVELLDKDKPLHAFTSGGLIEFRKNNPWVHNWSLYQIAKQKHDGAPWYEWEEKLKDYDSAELEKLREDNRREYWRHIGEQLAFETQWEQLRKAAENRKIELIGDIPFFVSHDSADVWANQRLFLLDQDGLPTHVSGVPPDAFTEDGQLWGTPIFDWDNHRSDGFAWWRQRVALSLKRFHRLRIDHFRAIESYWSIPFGSADAKEGQWCKGPQDELLSALRSTAGEHKLIAEDLGIIPQEIVSLRRRHNMDGMAVLHFAFDGNMDNPYLPANIASDTVCYSGTHDNDTTVGWYSNIDQDTRDIIAQILASESTVDKKERPIHRQLMRSALASEAATTVFPLQDVMGLDSNARMNTPGTTSGNWEWQFMWVDIAQNDLNWLAAATESTGRWQGGIENKGTNLKESGVIAYLTAEVGIRSDLPTYSGGLGVLAGDHIKAAADRGLEFVAVTLLYRHGSGRQHLDSHGKQTVTYPAFDPSSILEDTGIEISLPLDNKILTSRIWKYTVASEFGGNVDIIFLDTSHPDNDTIHSAIGNRLYGGGDETRIRQEYLLGIGGIRALKALGIWPIRGLHLNEGHCAFATVEMLHQGWTEDELASRTLFTTHTPVPAGHDKFSWGEVEQILGSNLPHDTKAKVGGEKCSMSHLAAHYAGEVNAVSTLNSEVAAEMYPDINIHPVTNGVHHLTWTAPAMQEMLDEHLSGWRTDSSLFSQCVNLPDEALLTARRRCRTVLIDLVRVSTGVELDPDCLTIGFARRFATYKRADLVFQDLERLLEIGEGRIQFVFAGKAHPRDEEGKALIKNVFDANRALKGRIKVAFLENYSMTVGLAMTSGVDIWLNNPVRPMEASGTSGMKATLNGVPNCSILDGWWPEACEHGVNGWAIGGTEENRDDERDAKAVLDTLENEVLPAWDAKEKVWLELSKRAMASGAEFTAARMIEDYLKFYNAFGN